MNIVRNEKMVARNAKIGSAITLVSLVVLGTGMYITFTKPELFSLSIGALLLGFILSQIGIFYTNRWGRKPRPDQVLDQALKGLGKNYTLYHYHTPAAHVLVGPAGVWTLIPKHQRGTITYSKDRWRQRGGGLLHGYLKLFAQEGIGRPDLEIASDKEVLTKYLRKRLPDLELPDIQSTLVFFHPDVNLEVDEAPAPTLFAKKLKDFIRKEAKEKPITPELLDLIRETLGG
jgi:hypothetical protein